MVESKATRSSATSEIVVVAQAMINQPPIPLPSQQSVVNLEAAIPLHPNLVQTPQIVKFVQLHPIGPQIPLSSCTVRSLSWFPFARR